MTDIEGEVIRDDQQIATQQAGATTVYNPLDAEPIAFKQALQSRQENYDSLAQHLRLIMTPGVDFGRIHHDKNCREGQYRCQDPRHWTPYDLWSPGADKILGVLNLGAVYPGAEDYKRAALKGMPINDVIVDCQIDNGGQVIAQGMGACSRDEPQIKGDLNRCIKRACKRARVDAVKRLPTVASLFEDQAFWRKMDEDHKAGQKQQFQQSASQKFNTGALLEVMPIGKKLKGQRFDEMSDGAIDYILNGFEDKPDIWKAAKRVKDARSGTHNPPPRTGNGARPGDSQPRAEVPEEDDARAGKDAPAPRGEEPLTQADAEWLREYEEADIWGEESTC